MSRLANILIFFSFILIFSSLSSSFFSFQTLKQNTQVKTPSQESPSRGGSGGGGAEATLLSAGTNSSTLSSTDSRPSVKKESVATQTPSRSALVLPSINHYDMRKNDRGRRKKGRRECGWVDRKRRRSFCFGNVERDFFFPPPSTNVKPDDPQIYEALKREGRKHKDAETFIH